MLLLSIIALLTSGQRLIYPKQKTELHLLLLSIKHFFVGGGEGTSCPGSDKIEIYDSVTGEWAEEAESKGTSVPLGILMIFIGEAKHLYVI